MLSRLSIHLLAGGFSSRRRHKRAASRTPRPHSVEIESESDQETLASRRAQIDDQRKKKKKAMQMALSDMRKSEFIEWRKINFYDQPQDLTIDNYFWCYDQEILFKNVYAVMSEKKKVCPMKAIDFAHLMKKADYFGTTIRVVDCLGLRRLMETECNYNMALVQ